MLYDLEENVFFQHYQAWHYWEWAHADFGWKNTAHNLQSGWTGICASCWSVYVMVM